VAKWLLYDAALEAGAWPVIVIAWLVSAFTAFYILKATVSVFYGETPAELATQKIEDAPPRMQVGMGILAAACLLFGLAPQLLVGWIAAPAVKAMGFHLTFDLTFLGLHTASAGAPVTAGAILAVVALLAAGVAFGFKRPAPRGVSAFSGGDPLPEENTLSAEDFAEFAEDTFQPVLNATNPDPLYLKVGQGIDWLGVRLGRVAADLEKHPLLPVVLAAVVIIAAVWWL
jgi:multicomponent K+:H+ antiporter subunit A